MFPFRNRRLPYLFEKHLGIQSSDLFTSGGRNPIIRPPLIGCTYLSQVCLFSLVLSFVSKYVYDVLDLTGLNGMTRRWGNSEMLGATFRIGISIETTSSTTKVDSQRFTGPVVTSTITCRYFWVIPHGQPTYTGYWPCPKPVYFITNQGPF